MIMDFVFFFPQNLSTATIFPFARPLYLNSSNVDIITSCMYSTRTYVLLYKDPHPPPVP